MTVRGMMAGLLLGSALGMAPLLAPGLAAQEAAAADGGVWIQVEALPTLGRAQSTAEGYASQVEDVEGYYLGSGWYGVALGPYSQADAEAVLARLAADGIVPGDAVLVDGSQFRQQFWPLGSGAAASQAAIDEVPEVALPEEVAAAPVPEEPEEAFPEESPEEARASEALLTQGEREQLQLALQWAGVYDGGIDGAFGSGTRTAMALWQQENGQEATGILTTAQRAALLRGYNGILEGLDLRTVAHPEAGIEMLVPQGVLGAPVSEPPFVRFDATDGSVAQLLLISQPGDQDALFGLYEILQTLEVVPIEGPRERGESSFVIEGTDGTRHAHVEASLGEGHVKGFALIWPAADRARLDRLIPEMRASFRRLPGVLDPQAGTPSEDQAVDLVSGLQVRQPRLTASGFFVDGLGTAVTAAGAVADCERVTLDEAHPARVAAVDEALGLAVLRPEAELAPRAVAAFQTDAPRLDAEVAVAGFPYGGALTNPVFTFGKVADLRGLAGEEEVRRLDLAAAPGDAGGAVVDAGGAVLGMLLPKPAPGGASGEVLPDEVAYALDAQAILQALAAQGITPATTPTAPSVGPERLTREAAGLAVLVSCW